MAHCSALAPAWSSGPRPDPLKDNCYILCDAVVELDEEEGGMAIKAELAGLIGRTSMPAVFVGGEFVGGCNDGGMGGVKSLHERYFR